MYSWSEELDDLALDAWDFQSASEFADNVF